MRDGIMYFAVIFVSNLVTVLIFVFAPPDLKVINASFSTLITSLMVSRLMLNLRGEVLRRGPVISSHHSTSHNVRDNVVESYQLGYTKQETETGWSAFSSIVGNLGAPVITFEAENSSYYDDFNEDEDDVIDPGFLQTIPHNSKSTRKPLPHIPHVYPPPPHSPRSADRMRKTYDSHSFHSRQLTESSDETMGWTKVSMPDTPPPSGPSSPTLRSVNRQPSAESSSSASAFNFAALPHKTKLARLKSLSRPRTADSATSERDVVEMMQTRSMPAPLVVQVTEEVVVDHVPDEDDGGQDPKSAEGGSGSRNRKPWLAPPSWRLSRDGHYEEG
ncbi:hypothetical protein GSI_10549 [Ganoderma sinense ZZ0214-1]|uniref:Uncharacterized protein n=1 Tax=Ganoderma sinense ZZ0214-1 TaxID=1077348 RepID=A0A2G8S0W1_9APHY|nr:hypothetical protein GSI_10549 [Ganoderma sinense ZZ0214-1]